MARAILVGAAIGWVLGLAWFYIWLSRLDGFDLDWE